METTTKGLRAIKELFIDLKKLPIAAAELMFVKVKDDGVAAMQDSIALTVGEKSTGRLMNSIEGEVVKQSGLIQITVGSNLASSKYAASDIASTVMNRAVQVMPGEWRWIGIRPPMPAHPFLVDSVNAMVNSLEERLPQTLDKGVGDVFREAQSKEGESP
jgi:hypothetical protein